MRFHRIVPLGSIRPEWCGCAGKPGNTGSEVASHHPVAGVLLPIGAEAVERRWIRRGPTSWRPPARPRSSSPFQADIRSYGRIARTRCSRSRERWPQFWHAKSFMDLFQKTGRHVVARPSNRSTTALHLTGLLSARTALQHNCVQVAMILSGICATTKPYNAFAARHRP